MNDLSDLAVLRSPAELPFANEAMHAHLIDLGLDRGRIPPSSELVSISGDGFPYAQRQEQARRCARIQHSMPLGLALSEKQIPRIVESVRGQKL
jgi:hypothetical protein